MNEEATLRAALGRQLRAALRRFRFRRAAKQSPLAVGERRHRAPADTQSPGDLPLRMLAFLQEANDFFDDR